MKIRFVQEYFMDIEPEWYPSYNLSGEGSLEQQILEVEIERAKADGMYLSYMKPGEVTAVIVREEADTNSADCAWGACQNDEQETSKTHSVQESENGTRSLDS